METSSTDTRQILLEGVIKHRTNKKWKSRWTVVRKISPVADCLNLDFYRNCKEKLKRASASTSITLEHYLGIESCFTLDKECNTIAIICRHVTVILAFETREILTLWKDKIQAHFCKEQHYLVNLISVPAKSKLVCGSTRLLLQDYVFCLVADIPPRLLGYWPFAQLRRFGVVDDKFCFEGGSHCVSGPGLHVIYSNECGEICKHFEMASSGQLNALMNEHVNGGSDVCHLYGSKYGHIYRGERPKHDYYLGVSTSPSSSLHHYPHEYGCDQYRSSMTLNGARANVSHLNDDDYPKPSINEAAIYKTNAAGDAFVSSGTLSRLSEHRCSCPCRFAPRTRPMETTNDLSSESSKPNCMSAATFSSPSTSSFRLNSDRESLFSRSSESSNSSSGFSGSLSYYNPGECGGRVINHTGRVLCNCDGSSSTLHIKSPSSLDGLCESSSTKAIVASKATASHRDLIESSLVPSLHPIISPCEHTQTGQHCPLKNALGRSEHNYSQLEPTMADRIEDLNYDIPRNICMNSLKLNNEPRVCINHQQCDTMLQSFGNGKAHNDDGDNGMLSHSKEEEAANCKTNARGGGGERRWACEHRQCSSFEAEEALNSLPPRWQSHCDGDPHGDNNTLTPHCTGKHERECDCQCKTLMRQSNTPLRCCHSTTMQPNYENLHFHFSLDLSKETHLPDGEEEMVTGDKRDGPGTLSAEKECNDTDGATYAPDRASHAPDRASHAPDRATHAPDRATHAPDRATHAPDRATHHPTLSHLLASIDTQDCRQRQMNYRKWSSNGRVDVNDAHQHDKTLVKLCYHTL